MARECSGVFVERGAGAERGFGSGARSRGAQRSPANDDPSGSAPEAGAAAVAERTNLFERRPRHAECAGVPRTQGERRAPSTRGDAARHVRRTRVRVPTLCQRRHRSRLLGLPAGEPALRRRRIDLVRGSALRRVDRSQRRASCRRVPRSRGRRRRTNLDRLLAGGDSRGGARQQRRRQVAQRDRHRGKGAPASRSACGAQESNASCSPRGTTT